jgi:excisionase family DNA binding protein
MKHKNTSQGTMDETLWDKVTTARYLGISRPTLDRWLAEGRGPRGLKVGVQVRYRPADVHAFLESCSTVGGAISAAPGHGVAA